MLLLQDVLCGRGGLTNQHAGNEWFRRLVRSNRGLYRSCPKHTKLLVAKAIVQAVQQQDPPGRFLEVADKDAGTWIQINYKRAVDKTSQALREKEQPAPGSAVGNPLNSEVAQLAAQAAASKGSKKNADLSDLAKATLRQAGLESSKSYDGQQRQNPAHHFNQDMSSEPLEMGGKRKMQGSNDYAKASWWQQGAHSMDTNNNNMNAMMNSGLSNKRIKMEREEAPAPPEPLQTRQSSLFRFLNGSGIFGRSEGGHPSQGSMQMEMVRSQASGFFPFSSGNGQLGTHQSRMQPTPSDLISIEASAFESGNSTMAQNMGMSLQSRQSFGIGNFDPLPLNGGNNHANMGNMHSMQQQQNNMFGANAGSNNNMYSRMDQVQMGGQYSKNLDGNQRMQQSGPTEENDPPPPPMNRLTTQVSDWLVSFWPLGKDQQGQQESQSQMQEQDTAAPPPPASNLERGVSSTIFNMARSPSQFLTSLKSGVSSMFGGDDNMAPVPVAMRGSNGHNNIVPEANVGSSQGTMMGTASSSKRDSLLDDYEETALETRLRSVTSL